MSVFSLTGDADAIGSSAGRWSTFSTAAATAAADIRRIDSGDFQGDEADSYREKLNTDLPPHLDTTSQAWSVVAAALQTYAAALAGLQTRMATLAGQAGRQQDAVDAASNAVADARTADARHTAAQHAATEALKPGEKLPPDTYHAQTGGAAGELSNANAALQATIDAANTVRAEHTTAVQTCVGGIDRAKAMRFAQPPGFFGRLKNSVTGWISDHTDVLKSISGVLKTISGIAGLLAMIPVLAPIMGPIALVTGGVALAIDVTVKVVTGEGSWTSIGLDGALMVLPGAGKLLKGAVQTTKTGQAIDRAAGTALALAKDSKAGQALTVLKNSRAGTILSAPARGLERVNTKIAQGLSHVPGANRLPSVKMNPRQAAQAAVDRDPSIIQRTRDNPLVARRPHVDAAVRRDVINSADRVSRGDNAGDIICARTGEPIPVVRDANNSPVFHDPATHKPTTDPGGVTVPEKGTYDLGHSESHEWSYTRVQATDERWTTAMIKAQQNNPKIFGVELKGPNRGAGYDAKLIHLLPGSPLRR